MSVLSTMAEMWERNFRLYADRDAVVCDDRRLTYGELGERVRKLGSALRLGGVKQRDRIGMLAMNCGEWFDFYACCELNGFHALTINYRLVAAEIDFILRDAAPKVLIFEAQYAGLVDSLRDGHPGIERYICIGATLNWAEEFEAVIAAGSPDGPRLPVAHDDPVHLIYTSGTTGKPKGVIRSQRAALGLAAACAVSMNFHMNGRALTLMPMFHTGAQSMSSGQHWCGGTVVIQRKFDTRAAARAIEDERIQMTHMTPVMLRQFIDEVDVAGHDFSSLTTLCYAAAPMPGPLLKRCVEIFGPILYDCYGSTESGNVSVLQDHFHVLDDSPRNNARLASVGQEHIFSRLRICDDAGNDMPVDTPGELLVRGDGMMDGYWNNSVATADAFHDGWYRSGDVARMDADGFVTLVDRKKDMIVSGGENIYCREVEEALATHGDVADVAVIGVPDERWGEAVLALIVLRPGATADAAAIIAHSRALIASYKRPRDVTFIDEMPRLSTGKIDKKVLRVIYAAKT